MYRNILCSLQTPKHAGGGASPAADREKAGDAEAGGARRSEVRRDGAQGVFGRAMDVHVLKTGT